MDPEDCVSAHDLYVSVLQVECLMAGLNLLVTVPHDVLPKFGRGQVGYGGDGQGGGRDSGGLVAGRCVGGRLSVMLNSGWIDNSEDGRAGDTDIGRDREVLGRESDRSLILCRDFSSHLSLPPSSLHDIISFFVSLLQPRGAKLAKFLVLELAGFNGRRWDE